MKKVILYLGCVVFALSSCKETPPPINFSDVLAEDSTYVLSTMPAAEPHNVLIEEFTGPSCANCPGAKRNTLDPLLAANPGRINVVALHVTDFAQANPVNKPPEHIAKYDFRDSVATLIERNIYSSLFAMPIAGVDRMPFGNANQGSVYQILANGWTNAVNRQLALQDSMNLDLKSTYNAAAGTVLIEAKITYLYSMSSIQHLSVVILEDSLIDLQDDGLEVDTDYHFEDVFRAKVTGIPFGDPILTPTLLPTYPIKEAGRVYVRRYTYKVKSSWNLKHCRVVAFIHKSGASGGNTIMQSKQAPLIK